MAKKLDQSCCAPEGITSSGNFGEDLSLLCKALGHSARVRIIQLLAKQGSCISGDLAEAVELAPSTVSEHLRILKEAGFIQGTVDGPKRCYCLNKGVLAYVQQLINKIEVL